MREQYKESLLLGATGFGGPLAVLARIEELAVRRKGWISKEKFTEILTLCKLLPGPQATHAWIWVSREATGRRVAATAGVLFILPGFLAILLLGTFYQGTHLKPYLFGPALAAIVIIAHSIWIMGRGRLAPNAQTLTILATSFAMTWVRPSVEPLVIVAAGLYVLWVHREISLRVILSFLLFSGGLILWSFISSQASDPSGAGGGPDLLAFFWICFKASAFTFGSGLAIIPLLGADLVERLHWMDAKTFLDGVALGQVTPGPVLLSATFFGLEIGGLTWAIAATFAVFLPSFLLTLWILPALLKRSPNVGSRLQTFSIGALPAVIGAMASTTSKLAISQPFDLKTGLVWILCIGAFRVFQYHSLKLIVFSFVIGGALHLVFAF